MSGDPLMAYWSSQYDVACCLLYGMCECEQSCDQSYVKRGLLPPADERDALARLLDESLEREKALEARADAERERAERWKRVAGRFQRLGVTPATMREADEALAADDRHRAAQGEGT